jgi:hypothetical protein
VAFDARFVASGGLGVIAGFGGTVEWTASGRSFLRPTIRVGVTRTLDAAAGVEGFDAKFSWTMATLELCPLPVPVGGFAEISPCAGVELGSLRAASSAPPENTSRSTPWIAPDALVRLVLVPRSSVALDVFTGVSFPLMRDRFRFEPQPILYRPPAVLPVAGLSGGVRFW